MAKDRISEEISRYNEAAQKDFSEGKPKYASGHRDVLEDIFMNSNADKQVFIDTYNKSYEAAKANYTPPSRSSLSSHQDEVRTTESSSDDYDYDDSNVSSGYTSYSPSSVNMTTSSRSVESSSKESSGGNLFLDASPLGKVLILIICILSFAPEYHMLKDALKDQSVVKQSHKKQVASKKWAKEHPTPNKKTTIVSRGPQ